MTHRQIGAIPGRVYRHKLKCFDEKKKKNGYDHTKDPNCRYVDIIAPTEAEKREFLDFTLTGNYSTNKRAELIVPFIEGFGNYARPDGEAIVTGYDMQNHAETKVILELFDLFLNRMHVFDGVEGKERKKE